MRNFLIFLSVLFSLTVYSIEYTVESLPNPKTYNAANFVSNPDGILSQSAVSQLNSILNSLEKDTRAEVAVVVVNSIGYEDLKDFGVRLFEKWGIGKAGVDNGLLILFVLDQREIIFEVGYGLEGILPDAISMRIINQEMLPQFRNENYDAGMIAGVQKAASVIREEPVTFTEKPAVNWSSVIPIAIGIYIVIMLISLLWANSAISKIKKDNRYPHNAAKYTAINHQLSGITSIMAFVLPFMAIIFVIFFWNPAYALLVLPIPFLIIPARLYAKVQMRKIRKQPIPCKVCDGSMRLLSEKQEDVYLNPAQQMEEKLGSVDYDVYKCDSCDEVAIYPIDKKSKYSKCPNCGTKAFSMTDKKIAVNPTYTSTGIERVTYKCKFCGYEEHKDNKLPRLQRTAGAVAGGMAAGSILGGGRSSGGFGGGGSFGGGRSGGGGARGRW